MNGDRNVGTGDICTTSLSIVEACCEPGTRDIERGIGIQVVYVAVFLSW